MFKWLKKSNRSEEKNEQVEQARLMFEQLESHSFRGTVHSEDDLRNLNHTIDLAMSLRKRIIQSHASNSPLRFQMPSLSLTQVYLAAALDSRVRHYRQQIVHLTGYSFHLVRELAERVKSQAEAKQCLQRMLDDLNFLLSEEMREDVGLRELLLEWRCYCHRALSDYHHAIEDAKQIIKDKPTEYKSYVLLSECYQDYANYKDAIEAATKAIEYAGDDLQRHHAYSHRASVHKQNGNNGAANQDTQRAATFEHGVSHILDIIGLNRSLYGETDET